MVSAMEWATPIDLTGDSDSTECPVSYHIPRPQPKRTPVPLPENIRHLYEPVPSLRETRPHTLSAQERSLSQTSPPSSPEVFSTQPAPQVSPYPVGYGLSAKQSENTSGSSTAATNARSEQSSLPFVTVYDESALEEFPVKRPEKRRRLSNSRKSKAEAVRNTSGYSGSGKENGRSTTTNNGFGIQRTEDDDLRQRTSTEDVAHLKAVERRRKTNKLLSAHSLNEALRTKRSKTGASEDKLVREARALHISSSGEGDKVKSIPPTTSKLPNVSPTPRSALAYSTSIYINSSSSDSEVPAYAQNTSRKSRNLASPMERLVAPATDPPTVHNLKSRSRDAYYHDKDEDEFVSMSPDPLAATPVATFMPVELSAHETPDSSSATQSRPLHLPTATKSFNRFSETEDHTIIYLKEVKQCTWKEMEPFFPNRKLYTLQSRYSKTLNKRDRSKDPAILRLPKELAMEAATARSTLLQAKSRPSRSRYTNLDQDSSSFEPSTGQSPILDLSRHDCNSDFEEHQFTNAPALPKRRGRPRKSEQAIDYALPRRQRASRALGDIPTEGSIVLDSRSVSTPRPAELETSSITPHTVPIEKPLAMEFEREDAMLALSALSATQSTTPHSKLPYLAHSQRLNVVTGSSNAEWDLAIGCDWQGSLLHVDLNNEELDIAERTISKTLKSSQLPRSNSRRKRLQKLLRHQPEPTMLQLEYALRYQLANRDRLSIQSFLRDAKEGRVHAAPHIERLGPVRPSLEFSSTPHMSTSSFVRQRELGLQSRRGWKGPSTTLSYQMKNKVFDTLGLAGSYTGASSDVHTVAWSPDGQCFAAGAVNVTDPSSLQYNRPNNLLYGDLNKKVIHELAEHYIERPRTESGPNSTDAMILTQDPRLFTTVSMVAFSPNGEFMFSAGYDQNACIWQATSDGSQPELLRVLSHKAKVDLLSVSVNGLVATAAKKWDKRAIKVISIDDEGNVSNNSYTSQKAIDRPDMNILPTAMQFEPNYGRLLLAGFGANKTEDRVEKNGDVCLWDVETQQQLNVHGSAKNVFDVAWNQNRRYQSLFAIGCVAGTNTNRGMRSVVRLYDTREYEKYSMSIELECPALDMNDVVFCPYDENYIAAGCTSGKVYVWDLRNPDHILYQLAHGKSLMPLDEYVDTETADTGVRFLSWGDNATRLYTGSSDGNLKVWDITRSPENVFLRDAVTVNSGIMSGAFSPDKSRLLLGEVDGSINVLEVGRNDGLEDVEKFRYTPYDQGSLSEEMDTNRKQPDSGIGIASQLIETGQMQYKPCGGLPVRQAVQGPHYTGPFSYSADASFLREEALRFQTDMAKGQGPQCHIASCRESIVKLTLEQTGDSQRSAFRIPDEMRQRRQEVSPTNTAIPGRFKCLQCGRAAQPRDPTGNSEGPMLCERCSFTCFRCGAPNKIGPETDTLACSRCKRVWDIGALGYECIQESRDENSPQDVPFLKALRKEIFSIRIEGDDDTTYGDEMNALTEFYHSLALDRPVSPPL